MSVAGFDVGNFTSVVALARRKGVDVILNKESKRETPSMVGFGSKQRHLGTDASAAETMNTKNTVSQLKRIIGKKFQDPELQEDMAYFPFRVVEGTNGKAMVQVNYLGKEEVFEPEKVMAMLLTDLKTIAETDDGSKISDCVISVPVFYTDEQRRAVLDASKIAKVNCLRLMHDCTATALAYGIYKTDLPVDKPLNVAFVDLGHSALQISIVAFTKGRLQVLAHAWDENLGGRDFDNCLFEHFAAEFKEKTKLDVKSNAKATLRMRKECEKLKKILSANPEAPFNIECLMEDTDLRSQIARDKFEELCEGVLSRVLKPCEHALALSGLSPEDVSIVELVGSSSRVPSAVRTIQSCFKKEVSRTLNASECVSKGCALQCAMLSPTFRVRDFEVVDWNPFDMAVTWEKQMGDQEGEEGNEAGSEAVSKVFPRGNKLPSSKLLTFYRNDTFSLKVKYLEPTQVSPSVDTCVGTYKIGPFKCPAEKKAKLKVTVSLDLNGLVSVSGAQLLEEGEIEVEVQPAPEVSKMDVDGQPDGEEADVKMDGAEKEKSNEKSEEEAPPAPPKKETKKKIKRHDVAIAVEAGGLPPKELNSAIEKEFEYELQDRVVEETKEKKNDLEAYVLSMRSKLYGELEAYVKEKDREKFSKALDQMEDWLYEDGEDETKGVYTAKMEELKKMGDPIELRKAEDMQRQDAVSALQAVAVQFRDAAVSGDEQFSHIKEADLKKVASESDKALKWLDDKVQQQSKLGKSDNPCLLSNDIYKKRDMLDRLCVPILNQPKPTPPKVEEPEAKEEPMEDAKEEQPMET